MRDFTTAGFFALRTPLLPFDELQQWSNALEAPAALGDAAELEKALARDRVQLHARLHEITSRPEVREAIFVASPHLDEMFEAGLREQESERGQGIERAVLRYFLRMAGRPTPFGLCAGHSLGKVGDKTDLVIAARADYRRHTRLGMDYLFGLTEQLQRDPNLQRVFVYRPNSSLHRAAGRVRYVASSVKEKERSYHLVTLEESDYLTATLSRAEEGTTFAALAEALVGNDISLTEGGLGG